MELQKALYMIPVGISDVDLGACLPPENAKIVKEIRYFIVENVRTARRFLKRMDPEINISELTFYELNGHTPENEITGYINALRKGEPVGVMSEAGCPGVADPGSQVVRIAQREGFKVVPLVGPSSIILALMASGLNGQNFSFHGYLPVKDGERDKAIKDLENISRRHDTTQIFIETPYRNVRMMECLLKNLSDNTLLCVGINITNPIGEKIVTKTVKEWKSQKTELEKVPTIFLFHSS